MRDVKVLRKDGWHFILSGREVTQAQFEEYYPPIEPTSIPGHEGASIIHFKPVHSDAMAIHPEQIPQAMEHDRAHGVPTEYDGDGCPILTSPDHQRRYMNMLGFHQRNGGFSSG